MDNEQAVDTAQSVETQTETVETAETSVTDYEKQLRAEAKKHRLEKEDALQKLAEFESKQKVKQKEALEKQGEYEKLYKEQLKENKEYEDLKTEYAKLEELTRQRYLDQLPKDLAEKEVYQNLSIETLSEIVKDFKTKPNVNSQGSEKKTLAQGEPTTLKGLSNEQVESLATQNPMLYQRLVAEQFQKNKR